MRHHLNLVSRLLLTRLALVSGPAVSNYHHTPNGLGELIKQTDARGYESVMFYDTLGRLSERREYEGSTVTGTNPFISNWSYDGACASAIAVRFIAAAVFLPWPKRCALWCAPYKLQNK